MVKNLPAVQETWVRSLGWEDPLEKEMATHSSILAWRIPWTEKPCGLQSMGSQRIGHDWASNTILLQRFFSPKTVCPQPLCIFSELSHPFPWLYCGIFLITPQNVSLAQLSSLNSNPTHPIPWLPYKINYSFSQHLSCNVSSCVLDESGTVLPSRRSQFREGNRQVNRWGKLPRKSLRRVANPCCAVRS